MDYSLHYYSRNGSLNKLRNTLAHGANPNLCDQRGWTPLHYAVMYVQLEIVEELLAAGVDISIENRDGKTARECTDMEYVHENELEEKYNTIDSLLAELETEHIKEPDCE